jgi:hypothetical protein
MIYDETKIHSTLGLTQTSWSCPMKMTLPTVILTGMPELLVHFMHLSIIVILPATCHHTIQCKLTLHGYVVTVQAGKRNGYIDSASYLVKIPERLGSLTQEISSVEFTLSQLLHLVIPQNICHHQSSVILVTTTKTGLISISICEHHYHGSSSSLLTFVAVLSIEICL